MLRAPPGCTGLSGCWPLRSEGPLSGLVQRQREPGPPGPLAGVSGPGTQPPSLPPLPKVWESYERCLAPYLARAPRTISLEDTETLVYEALPPPRLR